MQDEAQKAAGEPAGGPELEAPPTTVGELPIGDADFDEIRLEILELCQRWAGRVAGFEARIGEHTDAEAQSLVLAAATVTEAVRRVTRTHATAVTRVAVNLGISHVDLARATGLGVEGARKRIRKLQKPTQ
jgi:hypothetical protein